MEREESLFTAFVGHELIHRGALHDTVLAAKAVVNAEPRERVALYQDATGRALDIDYRGTPEQVLARLAQHPLLRDEAPLPRRSGPGRPKLGVISREVSLLPRHWSWLAEQKGGASACLRRLVDQARKESSPSDQTAQAREAAHRFMWDMAGDLPKFEEASRAFYARSYGAFADLIASWPVDVRAHAEQLVGRLRALESAQAAAERGR